MNDYLSYGMLMISPINLGQNIPFYYLFTISYDNIIVVTVRWSLTNDYFRYGKLMISPDCHYQNISF